MSFELLDLKQIRVIRAKLKISRKELAEAMNVTPNMVTQIEIGNHKPSWDKAIKMMNCFKTKIGNPPGIVEEICAKKPYTLRPTDKIGTAEKIMKDNEWDCIPIVDEQGNLKGKITTIGIASISNKSDYKEISIREVIGESPPTVPYYTPTKWIIKFLTPPDCVLVTKNGKIFGIVDLFDAVEKIQE